MSLANVADTIARVVDEKDSDDAGWSDVERATESMEDELTKLAETEDDPELKAQHERVLRWMKDDMSRMHVTKAADDGNDLANHILLGAQEGGAGKRGKSLGFDINLCTNENLKKEWVEVEQTRTKASSDCFHNKITPDQKDELLKVCTKRHDDLVTRIQDHVDTECMKERGMKFKEWLAICKKQKVRLESAKNIIDEALEANDEMKDGIEQRTALEAASSTNVTDNKLLSKESLEAWLEKKKAVATTKAAGKAAKKAEADSAAFEKDPVKFAQKKAAAEKAAAERAMVAAEKKAEAEKARAVKVAANLAAKAEEAAQKAADPVAFKRRKMEEAKKDEEEEVEKLEAEKVAAEAEKQKLAKKREKKAEKQKLAKQKLTSDDESEEGSVVAITPALIKKRVVENSDDEAGS